MSNIVVVNESTSSSTPSVGYVTLRVKTTRLKMKDSAGTEYDFALTGDIGSAIQAYDANLQSLSALGTAADKIAYTTGVDTWAESGLSAFGRSFIDDADFEAAQGTLIPTYTWVTLPAANTITSGVEVYVSDVGGGTKWMSNGTRWTPLHTGPIHIDHGTMPIGIAPSGTMGANGAVTLGTALDGTYSAGLWLYFPGGAVSAGSAAGFYWSVMSSTTLGTVYADTYTPGSTAWDDPASPTAVVDAGPGAYTGVTSEITATSSLVNGGLLGANGRLETEIATTINSSASNKTIRAKLGTVNMIAKVLTTSTVYRSKTRCGNMSSESVQRSTNTIEYGAASSGTMVTSTVDTTTDRSVVITLQLAAATDYIILQNYSVEATPHG